jgi:hypothetical protein
MLIYLRLRDFGELGAERRQPGHVDRTDIRVELYDWRHLLCVNFQDGDLDDLLRVDLKVLDAGRLKIEDEKEIKVLRLWIGILIQPLLKIRADINVHLDSQNMYLLGFGYLRQLLRCL